MRTIPPAIDQAHINNCTAVAVNYGLKSAHSKDFDPNWLIGMKRTLNMSLQGNLDVLMQFGGLPIGEYSIEPVLITTQAQEWAKRNTRLLSVAQKYKIDGYSRIEAESALQTALNRGEYVVFSATVKTRTVDANGLYRPYSGSEMGYAHAMSAWRGNPDGTIRILNSWGANWGEQGQANMLASDILRGGDCWAYRVKGDGKMRIPFESTVSDGFKVRIYSDIYKSDVVGYLRAVDYGTILDKQGDWREVAVAQTDDLTVTGWVKSKHVEEV